MEPSINLRELTEAAAIFAEINITPVFTPNENGYGEDDFIGYVGPPRLCPNGWWSPATDNGDAIRLALRVGMIVEIVAGGAYCRRAGFECGSYNVNDPESAVRLAILRCAARHSI